MNAASCTAPQTGLCFFSAPRKRQNERSTVPVSDGIFMPGIRPDSGCCKASLPQGRGWRDARSARPRAALVCSFLAPPVPGTIAGSFLN